MEEKRGNRGHKMAFWSKIAAALKKTKETIKSKMTTLFKKELNDAFYEELEEILISADMSVQVAMDVVEELKCEVKAEKLKHKEDVENLLKDILEDKLLQAPTPIIQYPAVFMLVGVNGVGKTTTIGKMAHYFNSQKKTVTLAAGDTFRAAASEQLSVWAERANVRLIKHEEGSDPSAVVFDAIRSTKARGTDVLLIDTAGRLHVKENLMQELKKIDRVVHREWPQANYYKLLILDSTTGQNAIQQTKIFNEAISLDGVVLTKLDGTAKGGFVFSLCDTLQKPVFFVGVGEKIEDLELFDAEAFVEGIF